MNIQLINEQTKEEIKEQRKPMKMETTVQNTWDSGRSSKSKYSAASGNEKNLK